MTSETDEDMEGEISEDKVRDKIFGRKNQKYLPEKNRKDFKS